MPRAEVGEMANEEHLRILQQGVVTWNQWREDHPDERADLIGAHLARADLIGAHLARADLIGAHLTEASLGGTVLGNTNLTEVQQILLRLRQAQESR